MNNATNYNNNNNVHSPMSVFFPAISFSEMKLHSREQWAEYAEHKQN
jgi:hypothetical protein